METITLDNLPGWFWWVTGGLLLALVLYSRRFQLSFAAEKFYWKLPLIGKMARESKRAEKTAQAFWYNQEKQLLDIFFRWITPAVDESLFEICVSYLNKIGELGRKETPVGVWLVLDVMMLIEAASFGMVLTPKISPSLSLVQQMIVGYSIGFVVAVLLLGLTHGCGRELYKNSVINRIRSWFLDRRPASEQQETMQSESKVDLSHNQLDDDRPAYIQAYSRLAISGPLKTSHWMTFICLVAVLALAAYGYETRMSMYQALEHIPENGMANPLLTELSQSQQSQEANDYAAKMVYTVVTIIFLLLQVGGITIGYRYGFVGKESEKAAKILSNFTNKNDWLECNNLWRNYVIDQTQALLSKLQGRLRQVANGDFDSNLDARTVDTYLRQRLAAARPEPDSVATLPTSPDNPVRLRNFRN